MNSGNKGTSNKRAGTSTVAGAEAKLSQATGRSQSVGPEAVTGNRRKATVVAAAKEGEPKTKPAGNLAEFFAASPLRASRIKIGRVADGLRKLDL